MRARRDSAIGECEAKKSREVVPIPTKIDEFSLRTGKHELAAAARASRRGLVHQQIEADFRRRLGEADDGDQLPTSFDLVPGAAHSESSVPPFHGLLLHLVGAG